MKLRSVEIENFRAIKHLKLSLDESLTVFHGDNADGKTSVLSAIAVGLGRIPTLLPAVTGISFRDSDRRRSAHSVSVKLKTTDGVEWEQRKGGVRQPVDGHSLREKIDGIVRSDKEGRARNLPIVAFYDTDRAVLDVPRRRSGFDRGLPRYTALEGALSARADFRDFFEWFKAKEDEELRDQKSNSRHVSHELEAVRSAITSMIPNASRPRIVFRPLRFMVSLESESGPQEDLTLDQLSGGYRIILALVADLARRMAQGNPQEEEPLKCEAVVLIDEIELHLHPEWQQRVLDDLLRTFPNTQFLVSTHSPQVLTTVLPERVVELSRASGTIVAGHASAPTYGAESGDVLLTVMGVRSRPANNKFVQTLDRYLRLVADDQGESIVARELRAELEEVSPRDPALDGADVEIRRRNVLKQMAQRK
ncbi:MAG: AAA family ATPase [Spirochaetaceae bacterium]|nr:AAA family ATPase [Spirochaetaceae bacterium]